MLRKPPTLHYGSIGGKRKRNTAVLQRSMSRAGGLSRNSDSMADRRDRGSYTSPTLPCGSYPFVNLREANTLLRKLFTSRKSEKNVRQHSGTQKGAIEAITSINTGYMIRAPTGERTAQTFTTEYRRAAELTRRGDAAFTRGRFFYAAAYADRLLSACRTAADAAERIYLWHFSIAQ